MESRWLDQSSYKEDEGWSIVAITFPNLFTSYERRCAERTIRDSWPDAWEAIFGTMLQPGESREKDRRAFEQEHAGDWIVGGDRLGPAARLCRSCRHARWQTRCRHRGAALSGPVRRVSNGPLSMTPTTRSIPDRRASSPGKGEDRHEGLLRTPRPAFAHCASRLTDLSTTTPA